MSKISDVKLYNNQQPFVFSKRALALPVLLCVLMRMYRLSALKIQSLCVCIASFGHLFELLELVVLEAFTSYFNYIQAVGRSDIK